MQRSLHLAPRHLEAYASWTDEALVRGLRRSEELAFAEIYNRYGPALMEQAFRKVNSREAAEEIMQDLFTTLWQKRATADVQKLKEYLSSAIKYLVINLIKKRLTHAGYTAYCQAFLSEADHHTEEHLAAGDLARALGLGLAHLPGHTREIFQLSRMEHQTVPQIAVRLKLSPKAVEYHLTRALKLLRISLKDFLVLLVVFLANQRADF